MKAWLKLLADTLYSKLPSVGYNRRDAMPAGHVGGATAFAVTVTGVGTEIPLPGAVMVTIPFEVEADASEASRKRLSTVNFIEAPGAKTLSCPGAARGVWPIESRRDTLNMGTEVDSNCQSGGTSEDGNAK